MKPTHSPSPLTCPKPLWHWLRMGAVALCMAQFLPSARGQASIADSSIRLAMLDLSYQGVLPGGKWASRAVYVSFAGMRVGLKFKSNFYLIASYFTLFSEALETEGLLGPLITSDNFLIADDGSIVEVGYLLGGHQLLAGGGKIFPLAFAPNRNSGLYIEGGGGWVQHKFSFRTLGAQVAAIEGAYAKGYDRLAGGLGLWQGFGYRHFSNSGQANFSAGFCFGQYATRGMRSAVFPDGGPDLRRGWDLAYGFQLSWNFPLYSRAPEKSYIF